MNLIYTWDSRPISFYVNGSGCISRDEIEMEPQSAFLKTHVDQVVHCRGTKNAEGLIMIYTRNILPHAVFRVRLSGPEVHIVPFRHHSERLHYGQYSVARPGDYNVEVMMLYTHFNETHIQDSVYMNSTTLSSTSPFVVVSDRLSDSLSESSCDEFDTTWAVDDDGFWEYLRRTRTWEQDLWPKVTQ